MAAHIIQEMVNASLPSVPRPPLPDKVQPLPLGTRSTPHPRASKSTIKVEHDNSDGLI